MLDYLGRINGRSKRNTNLEKKKVNGNINQYKIYFF